MADMTPTATAEALLPDGPNGVFRQSVAALRFLAENPRRSGGQETFNSEHLHQLADELLAALTPQPLAPDDEALIEEVREGCLDYGGIDGNSPARMNAALNTLRRRFVELVADLADARNALAECRSATIAECASVRFSHNGIVRGLPVRGQNAIRALKTKEPANG